MSDHLPLMITIPGPTQLGPPRFVMNANCLNSPEILLRISTILQEGELTLSAAARHPYDIWLTTKKRITQLIRTNCRRRAGETRQEELRAQAALNAAREQLLQSPHNPELHQLVHSCYRALASIEAEKIESFRDRMANPIRKLKQEACAKILF